jgi:PAS domain-containing protein
MVPPIPYLGLAGAAVLVAAGGTALAWRERPTPGAAQLAWFLLATGWWILWNTAGAFGVDPLVRRTFRVVEMLGVAFTPGFWLRFVLGYVGSGWYDHWVTRAIPGAVGGATFGLVVTNALHGLMWTDVSVVVVGGVRAVDAAYGPAMYGFVAYAVLVLGLGAVLLFEHARESYADHDARTLVLTATAALPVVLVIPYVFDVVRFDTSPVGGLALGLSSLVAVRRYDVFGRATLTESLARTTGVEALDVGFLVIDNRERVVDANPAARRMLDPTVPGTDADPEAGSDLVGLRAREVVPEYDRLVDAVGTPGSGAGDADGDRRRLTAGGPGGQRTYELRGVLIRGSGERPVGMVILLTDVTRERSARQRLSVLNRIFRHDIRTEANVISGYASLLDPENGREADVIARHAGGSSRRAGRRGCSQTSSTGRRRATRRRGPSRCRRLWGRCSRRPTWPPTGTWLSASTSLWTVTATRTPSRCSRNCSTTPGPTALRRSGSRSPRRTGPSGSGSSTTGPGSPTRNSPSSTRTRRRR